jgi:Holliday junction resolvase RusA-like endonuclease
MAAVRVMAQQEMAGKLPFDTPVTLNLLCEFPIPPSWSKRKQAAALRGEIRFGKRPDGTNLQKLVEDALNGIVFVDDALIDRWSGRKIYGLQPKIVVTVSTA